MEIYTKYKPRTKAEVCLMVYIFQIHIHSSERYIRFIPTSVCLLKGVLY